MKLKKLIDMFLQEQCRESYEGLEKALDLINHLWFEDYIEKYFSFKEDDYEYALWDDLYESVLLYWFICFKKEMGLLWIIIDHWYYDMSYGYSDNKKIISELEALSDSEKESISRLSRYYLDKFSLLSYIN